MDFFCSHKCVIYNKKELVARQNFVGKHEDTPLELFC
jgi:hypothetical protein